MRNRTDRGTLAGSLDDDYFYDDTGQVHDHGATAVAPAPRTARAQLVHDRLSRAGQHVARWLACLTLGLFALLIGQHYGLGNRTGGFGVAAMLAASLGVFVWQARTTPAAPVVPPVRRASDRKGSGRRG